MVICSWCSEKDIDVMLNQLITMSFTSKIKFYIAGGCSIYWTTASIDLDHQTFLFDFNINMSVL